ncbi:MAG: ferritin-like domain-containing protein [Candidatus Bathyarchaeia archaeon]
MVDMKQVLKRLNEALAIEYADIIRYSTHATVISGPYAETVGHRLEEIAEDEEEHTDHIRELIDYYGGDPQMDVSTKDLKPARSLEDILDINIEAEKKAITHYRTILKMVNVVQYTWLYETLEDIIEDEEEHLYELKTLRGK